MRNFATIVDEGTLRQGADVEEVPIVYPEIALMPDAHLGYGCPIGAVVPTRGGVIPAAVGVDIACGMDAIRLDLTEPQKRQLRAKAREILAAIGRQVPVSAGKYHHLPALRRALGDERAKQFEAILEDGAKNLGLDQLDPKWRLQLGTLGGGNHFLEISADDVGEVWAVVHSGSRGVGNKIGRQAIKWAKQAHPNYGNNAWLDKDTPRYEEYVDLVSWCETFAEASRLVMLELARGALSRTLGEVHFDYPSHVSAHHNTVQFDYELPDGEQVDITRKGAIRADRGRLGIIPGSMGTETYIVEGLGNPDAYDSAPHGAGRVLSRRRAKAEYSAKDLDDLMKARGITYRPGERYVDEIPHAYKDINQVLDDSRTLVRPVLRLRQIVNLKGD